MLFIQELLAQISIGFEVEMMGEKRLFSLFGVASALFFALKTRNNYC